MRKWGEKIVQTRAGWHNADQVRKIKIVMTVIAVALCISLATGAVLAWVQIKRPFDKYHVSSAPTSSAETVSSNSEMLPVYDDSYNLVLVNATSQLKPDFKIQLDQFKGVTVDDRIIPALKKMMEDAEADGSALKLSGGFVDEKEQNKLFDAGVQNLIKNQGYSQVRAQNHIQTTIGRGGYNENQTGMAVTFSAEGLADNADFTATNQYKWLVKNSVHYGFVLRYTESKATITGMAFNPLHFRYVGEDNAVKMREYSMCLEEYAAYIRQQNPK